MLPVSGSESTSTGSAPRKRTALAVAIMVKVGIRTSSPSPTPAAASARCSAAVPLEHATPCSQPTAAANSRSNRVTNEPADEIQPALTHSATYRASLPSSSGAETGSGSAGAGSPSIGLGRPSGGSGSGIRWAIEASSSSLSRRGAITRRPPAAR